MSILFLDCSSQKKVLKVSKKLKPTNSGFLVMLYSIHFPKNMGMKKSSSSSCTCFKLSEIWYAFVVSKVKNYLINTLLKSSSK